MKTYLSNLSKCCKFSLILLIGLFIFHSDIHSQASHLVISQVYGGGGNSGATYTNDFVEIFNPHSSAISLSGHSIQYASATGTSWSKVDLPAFNLSPGQYFLLQLAGGVNGVALPTPDAASTSINMATAAGKVVLMSTTTLIVSGTSCPSINVVDLVGFGTTANCFEGSGPTPAPSVTNAAFRALNGCTDTDNNASNFSAASVAPRNSSSPFNVCAAACIPPVATSCPGNQTGGTSGGLCSGVVTYSTTFSGTPAPTVTYSFTGVTTGSGSGNGSGSTFNNGITNVTVTATNTCGTVNCTFTVTVNDITPPVAVCQSVTVTLDASGNGSITAAQVNNGSTDNCGIAGMSVSPSTFNCSNITTGPAPSDLIISEYIEGSSNNKAIELYNGTASSINLATGGYAIRVYANGAITPNSTTALTGTVAAGGVFVIANPSASATILGVANQTSGNINFNGNDVVELISSAGTVDLFGTIGENPGTEWGSGLVSTADNTLRRKSSVTTGVTTSAAGFPSLALEWDGFATDDFTGLSAHSISFGNSVTLTVTDINGLTSTCTANVTVIDNLAPSITTCAPNQDVDIDSGCSLVVPNLVAQTTASDNCSVTVTQSPLSGTILSSSHNQTHVVVITATDGSGNSVNCNVTLTGKDVTPPTAVCQNVTVTLNSSGNGSITAAQVNNNSTDNCGIANMSVSPSTFNCSNLTSGPAPSNLIISEYIEGSSNNKAIELYNGTASAINLATGGYAIRVYANGAITPNSTTALTGTVAAGGVFVIANPSASATILGVANQTSGNINFNGNDVVELISSAGTVDLFGTIGENPGTEWGSGLVSTADNTLRRKASVTTGVTTNGPGFPGLALQWEGFATDDFTGLGTHSISFGNSVTLTVTDINGLSSTCTANVTVVDNLAPSITTCAPNQDVNLNSGCSLVVPNLVAQTTATDNCSVTVTQSPLAGTILSSAHNQTHSVVITATDGSGNSVTCNVTLTGKDVTPPTAVCQSVTVTLNASGNGSITAAQVNNGSTDNCGIAGMSVSPSTFNCSDIGGASAIADLFISEYIEGSGNNKCIEIYNGTGGAVNLSASGYQLQYYFNGALTAGLTIPLTGTVAAGDVYVVCNSAAAAIFLAQADQTNGSGWFNGDDAVVLSKNSGATVLDIFGRIGEDPGTSWTGGSNNTADQTLRRNNTITSGITVNPGAGFPTLASDWTGFPQDNAAGLGSHSVAAGTGTVAVTLTVTDINGLVSTCVANVTIQDLTPPSVVCQNISVNLDASGNAVVAASQVNNGSTDACGIASMSLSPSTFTCANEGPNNVILTVTDVNGNAASCSATVTIVDNTAPVVNCQSVTVALGANGMATITASQVNNGSTDNCGIANMSVSPSNFDCNNLGAGVLPTGLIISEYIEGSSNNKAIELYNGTGASINLATGGYAMRVYSNGALTPNSTTALIGTISPGGVFVISHSSANATILAQANQTSGNINFNGNDAVELINGSGVVDIFGTIGENPGTEWGSGLVSTADNTLRRKSSVLDGVTSNSAGFPNLALEWDGYVTDDFTGLGTHSQTLGSNIVTLTVTDASSNSSTCNAAVTVVDLIPPVINCPATATITTDAGMCTSSASIGLATATDNCSATVSGPIPAGPYGVGTTIVTWTATDLSGNSVNCMQQVIVTDNELPQINCLADITVNNDAGVCGAVVNYVAPTGSDNCAFSVAQTAGLPGGTTFPVGTTVNTFVVTDASGNTNTCSFNVTVIDNENPTITNVPANISSCNPVSWTTPTITDNCPGVQVNSSHAPGSIFPSGTTTVTYTATDVYGLQSSASFDVTILEPSVAAAGITSNRDNNNICLGENITLTLNGGSLGEAASWKWYSGTCGGAMVGIGTSITVSPTSTTTYFVRAEGTCNTTSCVQLQVVVSTGAPTQSPVYSVFPAYGAPGITDVISVNPVPGATYYQWFTNNGQINGVLFNGNISPVQTPVPTVNITFVLPQSNYQIRVFAGNACGRTGQSNNHIRGTVEAPTSLTGPTLACPGQTLSYTVSAVSGNNVTYNWQLIPSSAGTINGTGLTRTITFAAGFTSAQLCVNGVSSFGLPGSPICIVISTNAPTPGAISGLATPCEGSAHVYTIAAVTGASSYNWSSNIAGVVITPIGIGLSASVQYPSNTFSGNICVTANSACGLSAASCKAVSSGAPGIPGPISGPTQGICGASNVNYSLGTSNANNYTWTLPSGVTISGATNLNSVNLNFGAGFSSGIITVTAQYDCGTANSSISVNGAPSMPIVTPTTICAGTNELYFASSTGATSYNWNVSGADYSQCTNPPTCSQQYVEWSAGGGSFSVTASNGCGTSTPFNLSTNCRLSDDGSLDTKVYPNPTTGMVTIEFNSYTGGDHQLTVTDVSGRVVLIENMKATSGLNQHEIDLGFANTGMYMLYIKSSDGKISVTKIAVE